MSLTKLEVVLILFIMALVAIVAVFVGHYVIPNEDKTAVVTQENIVVAVPTETPVAVTVSPAPTAIISNSVGRRILNPIPTPVPTPEPVVNYAGSDKSVLDVPFDDLLGDLSLNTIAYQVGKKNWSTVTVIQQVKGYVWNPNERVELLDGSFEQMIYSQRGANYYLNNVSVPSGTRTFFRNKNIRWYASFLEVNQGGHKGKLLYGFKDGACVLAGYGFGVKTRPYSMGSDNAGGAASSGDSGGGDSGGGSSSGDSGDSGGGGPVDVAIQLLFPLVSHL